MWNSDETEEEPARGDIFLIYKLDDPKQIIVNITPALPEAPNAGPGEFVFRHNSNCAHLLEALICTNEAGIAAGKASMKVKPRFTERDAEIVELRDQKRKSWKEIQKIINSDPRWATKQKGKAIGVKAISEAYRRLKKQPPER